MTKVCKGCEANNTRWCGVMTVLCFDYAFLGFLIKNFQDADVIIRLKGVKARCDTVRCSIVRFINCSDRREGESKKQ